MQATLCRVACLVLRPGGLLSHRRGWAPIPRTDDEVSPALFRMPPRLASNRDRHESVLRPRSLRRRTWSIPREHSLRTFLKKMDFPRRIVGDSGLGDMGGWRVASR
jgi:hypothetical protein